MQAKTVGAGDLPSESKEIHQTSRWPYPDLDFSTLPKTFKHASCKCRKKPVSLRIPHLCASQAQWCAFFLHPNALMEPESAGRSSSLTKGDREMIVASTSTSTTSAANQFLYCVVAHGAVSP